MEKVTISRHWDNPHIHIDVTDKSIELSINIDDFVTAFIKELDVDYIREALINNIGSVTWVFTKEEISNKITKALHDIDIQSRMRDAVKNVISKVKEESTKVM